MFFPGKEAVRLEHQAVRLIIPESGLHGRRKIFTDAPEITRDNVGEVLGSAMTLHRQNAAECNYLYDYYKGLQDIQDKVKLARPEINNKVTVNIANEIVTFDTAFFNTAPIQYVAAGGEDAASQAVDRLNAFMRAEEKESKDKECCDWFHICGVAPRLCLPDPEDQPEGSPACIYTLDPREAFVVYHSGVGQRPMLGVVLQKDEDGEPLAVAYAKTHVFFVQEGKVVREIPRLIPHIPLVEYLNNEARMGAFEPVLSLLNAINILESNRVDSIQDFVNAFDVFQNCELKEGEYGRLSQGGMYLQISSQVAGVEGKVYRISSELNQDGVQRAIDDLYANVLRICGMPSQSGASASTSDTGTATIYRNGWYSAESRASDTEKLFNRAERQFLRVFLEICRYAGGLDLKLEDVKIEHTRNNLSNMLSRMQILAEGLNNSKIHPKIPWLLSGVPNAEEYYRMSQEYYEEQQERLAQSLRQNPQVPSHQEEEAVKEDD